jgi:ATP-dependent RNA helicase SUPV3L1/SUV3
MTAAFPRGRVRAILGPTNTGKTYLAIDRMLGHTSGVIGFPLRLLARENYDRIVALKGKGAVALITGEEKIVPANPRWFVCTVESMPMDLPVEFLAVDEIQLCGDPERGHIFTQRLLHARGFSETMFLGADTMRPLIRKLVPEAEIDERRRFSTLTYTGPRKITRLPRRAAIVAFSVDEVYAIAEIIRRQRGGTAVVLGALSPRTRNAQVALYQEGEVDYMVATDAIGMGLNMDVDHVAFAGLRKFDGNRPRLLSPAEIGQIAGRAGRHMNDGTFGVTNEVKPLDDKTVEAVENHHFDALKNIYWRNASLDFNSPKRLLQSLERKSPRIELAAVRMADDHDALTHLATDADIADIATNPAAVRLLWEVCQIPDFRKMLADHHLTLVRQIYLLLNRNDGRLPEDWVAAQIGQLEMDAGGIDTLTARIAHIRTWTYITHRADWLEDTLHWQTRTREIEDRLSDALHKKLTQRFVDRRAAFFDRKRGDGGELLSAVTKKGVLVVEGERVGHLEGLKFIPSEEALADKAIMAAARRALRRDMGVRGLELVQAEDNAISLNDDGRILWKRAPVARLRAGASALKPGVALDRNEYLDDRTKTLIVRRLQVWLEKHIVKNLTPVPSLIEEGPPSLLAEISQGAVRGVLFHLAEGLGSVSRKELKALLDDVGPEGRKFLQSAGIKLGMRSIYCPALLRVAKIRLRALLWSVAQNRSLPDVTFDQQRATYPAGPAPDGFWAATGHQRFGDVVVRVDRLEKITSALAKSARQGAFVVTSGLLNMAEGDGARFAILAKGLGYRVKEDELGLMLETVSRKAGSRFKRAKKFNGATKEHPRRTRRSVPNPNSPFAALQDLASGK